MNTHDFIKEHIKDNEVITNKEFSSKVERLSKYVEYLKLLQKKEVFRIFQELDNSNIIWNGCFRGELKKENVRYFIDLLLVEGLIKIQREKDLIPDDVVDYIGNHNVGRACFYNLTKKGKDLIKTNGIKKYLRGNE